ncbi:CapA family protein [Fluoribacter dumoffii]|uniref:CapA family protein n=1 Tax=Fluoribacter dumoffii TaxID=463 RepID=UPI0004971811|nr:CapA family protein [Fluoribacter dumoffii]MCW8384768.1 CapA family protein [Fluoribacter dumoffii]MCW8417831.1 CapA family protein [Fluoribacter dumoffii]MCW8454327.1 CapA family protein [Fluoribacter dumoffii]MCW8461599.1 CapA family protein [Fluoribacter dumoffii]MCW8481815.1 CapA family protein [Fluoribacter dumoffii]
MSSVMPPYRMFLCGDVMTGRGIDQILTHPCEPQIYESYVRDARDYVRLAEDINGKIPLKNKGAYVWGDGLEELNARRPDFRLINLETCITKSNTPWPYKGINYRMHPKNIDVITSAHIDVCVLANNHILDWGKEGFLETLATLDNARISYAGAGKNLEKAIAPAIHFVPGFKGRTLVFSMGLTSSGIFKEWAATRERPGVWLLSDLGKHTINQIKSVIEYFRKTEDLCIVSIHWGGNWGYEIPESHQQFAHILIDELGVNIIHGHSSHHPIGIELYNQGLILYGCGDLINDYEGISGWEEFKSDLSLMYFLAFDAQLQLKQLELVPMVRKNFKLRYASKDECQWMTKKLVQCSREFKTSFELDDQVIYCL